jgi:predicted glycosyltransferase
MKIWIDLDNTPHVPFFAPIITELEGRGHRVVLTARDAFQVCELADEIGLSYVRIGHHWGKNPIKKIVGLIWRSLELLPFCLSQRPDIALSHNSRSFGFRRSSLPTTRALGTFHWAGPNGFSRQIPYRTAASPG